MTSGMGKPRPGPFLQNPTVEKAGVWSPSGINQRFTGSHVYPSAFTSAAVATAVSSIGSDQKTLHLLPGTWAFNSAVTVPANVHLFVEPGALISKSGGSTLRVDGPITAPLQQIFSFGIGDVTFGRGHLGEVYPQWWGALADDTHDDTSAIQSAIASLAYGGTVRLVPGTYRTTGALTIPTNGYTYRLMGDGFTSTIIHANFTAGSTTAAILATGDISHMPYLVASGFKLQGDYDANVVGIFLHWSMIFSTLRDLYVIGFQDGIRIGECYQIVIDTVQSSGNLQDGIAAGIDITGTSAIANNIKLAHGQTNDNGRHGLNLSGRDITVDGWDSEVNTGSNVYAYGCFGLRLNGYQESQTAHPSQWPQTYIKSCWGVSVEGVDISNWLEDITPNAWSAGGSVKVLDSCTNDGGKKYLAIVPGVSAVSGGPAGTGSDITDGSVHWKYVTAVGQQIIRVEESLGVDIRALAIEKSAGADPGGGVAAGYGVVIDEGKNVTIHGTFRNVEHPVYLVGAAAYVELDAFFNNDVGGATCVPVTTRSLTTQRLFWRNTAAADVAASTFGALSHVTFEREDGQLSGKGTVETFLVDVEVSALNVAPVVIIPATSHERWRILDIFISNNIGTGNFDGLGDRLVAIIDTPTTGYRYSEIPSTTLKAQSNARWGSAAVPIYTSVGADYYFVQPTEAGAGLVAQYTGGSTNYTTGSLILMVVAVRVN
jgi:hypothetical protein